jgi:glycosyltransferase involved in cell wall biosynthesis
VHLNSSKAGFLGSVAGKLCGVKTVFTAHGFFFFENTPFYYKIPYILAEKFASLFRDMVIAVSEKDRENALKYRIIAPAKIVTIYNGLSPINFLPREQARSQIGVDDSQFVIGNIAQHYYRKGLDVLLRGVAALPDDIRKTLKLVLIGGGPETASLKALANELGLSQSVQFLGHLPNANRLLKAFDLFVLSSRVEGFPFALLEALQAGLPIIATDVGGNKEAVGGAGILVKANDQRALTDSMTKLKNDADLRIKLAAAASTESAKYSYEKCIGSTLDAYERITKYHLPIFNN